jgi:hypothetical protein
VPIATEQGKAITGVVRSTFTANTNAADVVVTELSKYDAVDPAGPDTQLTERAQMLGSAGRPVPRSEWRVAGHTVTLDRGFVPGMTYEISYRTANPPVAGLGYVAVRDTTAWLKHQPDALATVRFAYGYGSSQSGRFLRGFMYEGFNTDEHDRQVFDGVIAHIAGASRLSLNERWAKPTGLGVYTATAFPFADASLRDPVSGAQEGLLDNARIGGHAPKVFYTNTRRCGAAAALHSSHQPGQHHRSRAARPCPRVLHRRDPAFAESVSGGDHQRPADRQPGRLLVDDARALAGHAQVGEGRIGAAAEPVPAAAGSHARAGEVTGVPRHLRRRVAALADGRRSHGESVP